VRTLAHMFTSAIVVTTLLGGSAGAQEQSASQLPKVPTPAIQTKALVPLKVQIVLSRFQGEKKVSSLPYTLVVNANDGELTPGGRFAPFTVARQRTGAEVPVTTLAAPKESPVQGPMGPVSYHAIGTNIDCFAYSLDGDRFKLDIAIEDTSVYAEGQAAQGVAKLIDIPSFRTFQSKNTVILKDGQSSQFTAATDKISGEMTRVDVSVTVVK
jgi:hypothetical protein